MAATYRATAALLEAEAATQSGTYALGLLRKAATLRTDADAFDRYAAQVTA